MTSGQDEVSDGYQAAESDSADSLFITQKPARRRRHVTPRSKLTSHPGLEESEDESFPSDEEPKTVKKRKSKKPELPKYIFPFLPARRGGPRGALLPVQNRTLNNFVMGGFFKCVRAQWGGCEDEDDADSRPTVDTDGEDISPISEVDEEEEEEEDIRVVEETCFVKPSKTKGQGTWCTRLTHQRRRGGGRPGQETSPGASDKISPEASLKRSAPLPLDAWSSDDEGSSSGVLTKRSGGIPAPCKTEKRKVHRTCKKRPGEEELCSMNDATAKVQQSPKKQKRKERKVTMEPQRDELSQKTVMEDEPEGVIVDDRNVNMRKKKRRHRDPERGTKGNGLEEAEDWMKVQNESSGVMNSSSDVAAVKRGEGDVPRSKRKKKKSRRSKSEQFTQEVGGNLEPDTRAEDFGCSVDCNLENIRKKKRKLRDGRADDRNDDAEIHVKKRRRDGSLC